MGQTPFLIHYQQCQSTDRYTISMTINSNISYVTFNPFTARFFSLKIR